MRSGYEALATICGASTVGQDAGGGWGDLVSTVLSAAGEMGKRGIENVQKQEASERGQKKSAADLATAVAADRAATTAEAQAIAAAAVNLPSAAADRQAADAAGQAQDAAGAGLSPENQQKRVKAAQVALRETLVRWQKAPKDTLAEARVKAAQRTLTKAQAGQLASAAGPAGAPTLPYLPSPWPKRATAAGALGILGGLVGALVLRDSRLLGAVIGGIAGGVVGAGGAYAMEDRR